MSILELFVILIFLEILVGMIALLILWNRNQKTTARLKQYEINVNADIDESIPKILEAFVNTNWIDYRLKELDPMQIVTITPEHEKQIINDMSEICGDRLSDAMIDKLSLFWDIDSISSVIADKIYLTVVNYCAQFNATKQNVDLVGTPNT